MLPMGTIVTVCMFIGLLYALLQLFAKSIRELPALIHMIIGGIVFIAGFWNVFWYALRHITQFWGLAALVSGTALMLTGFYIVNNSNVPAALKKFMPIILLALCACMVLYGVTIYRL